MDDARYPFFLDSGNLALDLLNTGRASAGVDGDLIQSPEDLIAWLRASGLAADGTTRPLREPHSARILLTETRRLRDDVARIVRSHSLAEPPPPHAVYGVNRVLAAGRVSASLIVDEDGARLTESDAGDSLLATLAPVARAAAQLVIETDPDRLRRCASEACGRWFCDTSKGGRRKWCSMATCGNRAKAAAHRNRYATT